MKKIFGSLILVGALALPNAAFAEEEPTSSNTVSSFVLDDSKKAVKEFVPLALDNTATTKASAPNWVAESGLYILGGAWTRSSSYTDSTKTTRKQIDRIYAKTRHYVDGGLKGSSTDDQTNSSLAGAEVNSGTWFTGNDEVYGSHIFELSGFQSWYPETHKD